MTTNDERLLEPVNVDESNTIATELVHYRQIVGRQARDIIDQLAEAECEQTSAVHVDLINAKDERARYEVRSVMDEPDDLPRVNLRKLV